MLSDADEQEYNHVRCLVWYCNIITSIIGCMPEYEDLVSTPQGKLEILVAKGKQQIKTKCGNGL